MPEKVREALIQQYGKDGLELRLLHQYFVWGDRMRVHFRAAMKLPTPENIYVPLIQEPEKWLYMCYWYASAYTVVEGFTELGLNDARVQAFLDRADYVEKLKRFRNGVFHFQKKLMDDRFLDFIGLPESAKWITEFWEALSDYFLAKFGIKAPESKA
jgi:hypothetical protein